VEPFHRPGQSRPAIHVLPHGRRGIKSFSHRFARMKHGFFNTKTQRRKGAMQIKAPSGRKMLDGMGIGG
jgi:hypothetical protein